MSVSRQLVGMGYLEFSDMRATPESEVKGSTANYDQAEYKAVRNLGLMRDSIGKDVGK